MKKKLIILFCITLLLSIFKPVSVKAEEPGNTDDSKYDFGTYVTSEALSVDQLLRQARWLSNPSGGHGYAAEEANNLIDKLKGNNAEWIGWNNESNGPDRRIIGRDGSFINIQDKYYSDAISTINACFDSDGLYRYKNPDNSPMIVEVPADQYDDCVNLMQEKISNGKVPGITDPKEANNLVKKGNLTYKQAVNLTKAGNIDSLKYDAANSCVVALGAFGISTTIDFVIRIRNGEEYNTALQNSAINGLKTGANAFAISVITLQLSKTGLMKVFTPVAVKLVDVFGETFADALVKAYGVNAVGQSSRTAALNILKTQALAQAVTLIIITLPDVKDLIEGRISGKQLAVNLAVALSGIVGGSIGFTVGSILGGGIAPGIGNIIGSLVGSITGGALASYLVKLGLDAIIAEDAEEMIRILEKEFSDLCVEYLINQEEGELLSEKMANIFTSATFKDMYASKDRSSFAREKLIPLFEEVIQNRDNLIVPSDSEMRDELKRTLNGVVFIH